MALATGVRLGPYEVLDLIGAGGMGEVYKARDTRLGRTVALKVLPPALAAVPSLVTRFEREARAIAALDHPHICTAHDVGQHEGQAYLVMEHLEGETLADRLKKGALPLPVALEVGSQVADALAAAHRGGILHRDLKPGNVMLTRSGVKLLDFGLARVLGHGEQGVVEGPTSAPTEPAPLTARGTILGTVPYMAPEQLEGREADARTDVWALGAILYEMVAGRRAFHGESSASLIGAILEHEPPSLSNLQPVTPPALDWLVRRCLTKAPDDRWDSAHDVAEELRWIAATEPAESATGIVAVGRGWRGFVLGALALLLAASLGALAGRLLPRPEPALAIRSLLAVAPAEELIRSRARGGRGSSHRGDRGRPVFCRVSRWTRHCVLGRRGDTEGVDRRRAGQCVGRGRRLASLWSGLGRRRAPRLRGRGREDLVSVAGASPGSHLGERRRRALAQPASSPARRPGPALHGAPPDVDVGRRGGGRSDPRDG